MSHTAHIDWTQFVPHDYQIDTETEFRCSGSRLKDGLRVLILDQGSKLNLAKLMRENGPHPADLQKALRYNRWCTINDVQYFSDQVTFLATYEDGTMMQMTMPQYMSWIVKKDSTDVHTKKRAAVEQLIKDMLLQQDSATYHCKSEDAPKPGDVTDAIYKILGLEV